MVNTPRPVPPLYMFMHKYMSDGVSESYLTDSLKYLNQRPQLNAASVQPAGAHSLHASLPCPALPSQKLPCQLNKYIGNYYYQY